MKQGTTTHTGDRTVGMQVKWMVWASLFLSSLTFSAYAQQRVWTWESGPNQVDQAGTYGILGDAKKSNVPGGRTGMASWFRSNQHLWLFGGTAYDANGARGYTNDLWRYSIKADRWVWKHGSQTRGAHGIYGVKGTAADANTPGGRSHASYWTDAKGMLWLYGGVGRAASGSPGRLGDLWHYNPKKNQWTWIHGANTTEPAAVYGTKGTAADANTPGARTKAPTWVDDAGNLWLYGGLSHADSLHSDLWRYNPTTNQWAWMHGSKLANQAGVYGVQGTPAANHTPGARDDAAYATDKDGNFWLYGGNSTKGFATKNDVWRFNPQTTQWTWVHGSSGILKSASHGNKGVAAASNTPGSRRHIAMSADGSGSLWLYGGYMGAEGDMGDLWRFDTSTKQWTWIAGGKVGPMSTGSLPSSYGTKGVSLPSNTPPHRKSHTLWVDTPGNVWVFGGATSTAVDEGVFSDLWRYGLPINSDFDGVPDSVEVDAPNNGDGNNDGTADKSQSHVASFLADPTETYLTIEVTGTNAANHVLDNTKSVGSLTFPSTLPGNHFAPLGGVAFNLKLATGNLAPGSTVTVKMTDHIAQILQNTAGGAYRYYDTSGSQWRTMTSSTTRTNNTVTLTLTDGGIGDKDGIANGIIEHYGAHTRFNDKPNRNGLPINAIALTTMFDPTGRAFVGTYGFGIYRWSHASGWTLRKGRGADTLSTPFVYGLAAHGDTLFAATWGGGVFRSSDRFGSRWYQDGLTGKVIRTLAHTPTGTVYAAGNLTEVWIRKGGMWVEQGKIAPGATEPWDLAINPLDHSNLLAATRSGLYESADSGKTWVPTSLTGQTFSVEFSPITGDAYVGTDTGVQKRTKGQSLFSAVKTNTPIVYGLTFNHVGHLYVGYWGGLGVEFTKDGGATWTTLDFTAATQAASKSNNFRVTSVVASPVDGTLIVTTENNGVLVFPGEEVDPDLDLTGDDDPPIGTGRELESTLPKQIILDQNYPNPFNPETTIRFHLPETLLITLTVFDLLGRQVHVVHNGVLPAGAHNLTFDAARLPSGTYLYRLQTPRATRVRTMTLIK